jgi:hypothetical protein
MVAVRLSEGSKLVPGAWAGFELAVEDEGRKWAFLIA